MPEVVREQLEFGAAEQLGGAAAGQLEFGAALESVKCSASKHIQSGAELAQLDA